MAPTRVPAIEGWFTLDDEAPHLLGTRCSASGTVFFPPQEGWSPVPGVTETTLEPAALSRTGTVWSWSVNHYPPPEPYVAPDPFVPYTVVAVELADEQMVILGQLADGVDPDLLSIGMEVELVLGTLYVDGDDEVVVWKWKPVAAAASTDGGA
jgi:uncharacterized OB-fold protein